MKQTIEIEVPDGKKAVWNNGRIEFVDNDVIDLLKNSKNPEEKLLELISSRIRNTKDSLSDKLYNLSIDYRNAPGCSHLESIAKLKLFLAYLNGDHKFNLISGDIYYPYVRFYLNSKLPENEKAIGHFSYKGNTYALVSGQAYYDANAGLTNFDLYNGLGSSYSYCGFLACKDCKTAQFVATTFGKLLFDVNFGSLIKYKWLD